jgi:hypothetical protein
MINVGQQYGTNIINADGNSTVFFSENPKRDLDRLRQQLHRLDLRPRALAAAEREMDAIDEGMASRQVNKPALAGHLKRLTRLLQDAGALATAGQALAVPLTNLAYWMGQP